MLPYTQISNYDDNQFPSTLCFGTQGGDPGGGKAGGKRPTKEEDCRWRQEEVQG